MLFRDIILSYHTQKYAEKATQFFKYWNALFWDCRMQSIHNASNPLENQHCIICIGFSVLIGIRITDALLRNANIAVLILITVFRK